jgi:hypothetical protein
MSSFDRKFGPEFLSSVPRQPGVYSFFDAAGKRVYVGKAKNLRRRLGQYRNPRRQKKNAKLRSIIADAARVELQLCDSDLDACLLENRLIRELRPKWNVAGAFHFLYPMVGLHQEEGVVFWCYTTQPEHFPRFDFHGAFRSREITGNAFFALMRLFRFAGHALSPRQTYALVLGRDWAASRPRYSHVFGFRQLGSEGLLLWRQFLRGESLAALEQLALALLEHADARASSAEVQKELQALKRFYRHEAQRLARALFRTGYEGYPVLQSDRDEVFLRYRYSFLRPRRFAAQHLPQPGPL